MNDFWNAWDDLADNPTSNGVRLSLRNKASGLVSTLNRTDEALSELARLLEVDPGTPNIYWFIGTAYAWIGATDKAFDFFERQREVNINVFTAMGDSPLYAKLRDDPRWPPFLASVDLDPDFLASVEFNPRLPSEIRWRGNAATR